MEEILLEGISYFAKIIFKMSGWELLGIYKLFLEGVKLLTSYEWHRKIGIQWRKIKESKERQKGSSGL